MDTSHSLNYQHLYYFWMFAREGTMAAAAQRLHVSLPTLSVQVRKLQSHYDKQLLRKAGRRLELTEVGQAVFRYAESIFSVGQELENYLQGHAHMGPLRVEIGVAHVLPQAGDLAASRTSTRTRRGVPHRLPRSLTTKTG